MEDLRGLTLVEMGKKLNLSHLSEEECEKILAVIQRDFDLRNQEQERLSKIEEEIKEERTKDTILSKEKNFSNDDCCMRCLAGFIFLFRRRLQCDRCRYWVCKDCSKWDETKKVYMCNVCEKEAGLEKQQSDWFYKNVTKKFKQFASDEVDATLDVDPSQSIYSTIQSERERRVRTSVQGFFSSSSKGSGKGDTTETDGSDAEGHASRKRRSSFDSVCSKETQQFKEELQVVVRDLEKTLDESLNKDGVQIDAEVLASFEAHISSALRDLAQSLHLAVDNQNPGRTDIPVTRHHEVEHILTQHVETYLSDSIELGADDVPSPETMNGSTDYEEVLAKAIVDKIKRNRGIQNGADINSNSTSKRPDSLPANNPVMDNDSPEESLPQSPVRKIVPQESTDQEVDLRQLADATRRRKLELPTFDIHDDGALDSDLLATGTETEDDMGDNPDSSTMARWEVDSNISSVSMRSWKANWFFKEKNTISPYDNLGHKVFHSDNEDSVMMFVPKTGNPKVQIGDRDADEMSELSENRSDLSDISDFDENDPEASAELKQVTSQIMSEFMEEVSDEELDPEICFSRSGRAPSIISDSGSENRMSLSQRTSERSSPQQQQQQVHSQRQPVAVTSPQPAPRRRRSNDVPSAVDSPQARSTPVQDVKEKTEVKKTVTQELVEHGTECADIKFHTKPRTLTVGEGQSATFTAEIGCKESIDVFWYRDFGDRIEQLEHSEKYEILEKGKQYSLEIYDCNVKDFGQYMCIAASENGSSNWFFGLKVKDQPIDMSPPEFIKGLSDLERLEGQSAKLRVKVKGVPHPRVLWYKDGSLLEHSIEYNIERVGNRDYALTLDYLTLDHDAEYSVVANNRAGRAKSTAQLLVEPKPDEEEEKRYSPRVSYSPRTQAPPANKPKNLSGSQVPRVQVPDRQESIDGITSGQMSPDSAICSSVDTDIDRHRDDIIKQFSDVKTSASPVRESAPSTADIPMQSSNTVSQEEPVIPAPVYRSLREAYRRPPSQNMDFSLSVEEPDSPTKPMLKKQTVTKTPTKPQDTERSFTIPTPVKPKLQELPKELPPKIPYDEFQKQYASGIVGDETISRGTQRPKQRSSIEILDDASHDMPDKDLLQPYVDCGLKRIDSKRYKRDYVVNRSPQVQRKKWASSSSSTDVVRPSTSSDENLTDPDLTLGETIQRFMSLESLTIKPSVDYRFGKENLRDRVQSYESLLQHSDEPNTEPLSSCNPQMSDVSQSMHASGNEKPHSTHDISVRTTESDLITSTGNCSELTSQAPLIAKNKIHHAPYSNSINDLEETKFTPQPLEEEQFLVGSSTEFDIAESRSEYGDSIDLPSVKNLRSRFADTRPQEQPVKRVAEKTSNAAKLETVKNKLWSSSSDISAHHEGRKKVRNKLWVDPPPEQTGQGSVLQTKNKDLSSNLKTTSLSNNTEEKRPRKVGPSFSDDAFSEGAHKDNSKPTKVRNKLWVDPPAVSNKGSSVSEDDKGEESMPHDAKEYLERYKVAALKQADRPNAGKGSSENTNDRVSKSHNGSAGSGKVEEKTDEASSKQGQGKKKTIIRRVIRKIVRKRTSSESKTDDQPQVSSPLSTSDKTELPEDNDNKGHVQLVSFHPISMKNDEITPGADSSNGVQKYSTGESSQRVEELVGSEHTRTVEMRSDVNEMANAPSNSIVESDIVADTESCTEERNTQAGSSSNANESLGEGEEEVILTEASLPHENVSVTSEEVVSGALHESDAQLTKMDVNENVTNHAENTVSGPPKPPRRKKKKKYKW